MICPNCNKPTMILTYTDQQTFYYHPQAPKNKAKCNSCHASFENYDNGKAKREELEKIEREERETLKRLVKKYGVPEEKNKQWSGDAREY
jgi:phage gp16-like protein